jgi:serine/threonine-protein kinase
MGKVYRGEQVALGKTVAIKVIHQHLIADENAMARFYTEARASSRLNHPNSVSVIDFGRTDEGLLYLVMEFLRGKDLSHILWEEGPMPPPRAVEIVRQTLAALAEAHELGIIHRDIKPENVIIERLRTGNDSVKVVDFGLAKVRADVAPSVTMPGIVCGTPDYMAPEQGRGDPPDFRSDLYSTGVLLYQMVTGRLPFEADSPTQVVLKHMTEPVPDPRQYTPTMGDGLAEVLLRSLEKDASKRFQTALDFADALQLAMTVSLPPPIFNKGSDIRDTVESLPCPQCGVMMARLSKFCSECGYRNASDTNSIMPPSMMPSRPSTSMRTPFERVAMFTGRVKELAMIHDVRNRARSGTLAALRVTGEPGTGKSRLVHQFLSEIASLGDKIVLAPADSTWAGVAWAPIRSIVKQCTDTTSDDDALRWIDRHRDSMPSVRAGFAELFGDGATHLDGRARRQAVCEALCFVVSDAASKAASGLCVLVTEQLHRVDSASAAALAMLAGSKLQASVFIIGTHTSRVDPRWGQADVIVLSGVSSAMAQQMALSLLGDWYSAPVFEGDNVLPLLVDQLARWTYEGGGQIQTRLVDLVVARFDRLPPGARRILQALALIGESDTKTLESVVGESIDEQTWRSLFTRWWIVDQGGRLRITHELIREVVESGTSAAVRSDLAVKILDCAKDLPIEVRALLASQADEAAQALLLLETVGDRAIARGDDVGAVQALRRGLDRARRELHRGEIDDPERAMLIFARKLGESLARAGEVTEAEGVLREALEMAVRGTVDHARLLLSLARALFGRGRVAEASKSIDEALREARKLNAHQLTAELSSVRADFDIAQGATIEAIAQLRAADAALHEQERHSHDIRAVIKLRIEIWLRLARALAETMQDSAADAVLRDATSAAHRMNLTADIGRCEALRAEIASKEGDLLGAASWWDRAAKSAGSCGDVIAEREYRQLADKMKSARSPHAST